MEKTEKKYAYMLNTETTVGIDYRKYVTDYSEKSYVIKYKEYTSNKSVRTVYIPKSIVDEQGNLPIWWVEQQFKFPAHSMFRQSEEEIFQAENKLTRLIATASEARDPEKRAAFIIKQKALIEELKVARDQEIADEIARIVK